MHGMEDMRNAYKSLVGKAEGKRPLGKPRHRGMIISEWILGKRWESVEWIHPAQDRDQ